jgi:hypothetical protein
MMSVLLSLVLGRSRAALRLEVLALLDKGQNLVYAARTYS